MSAGDIKSCGTEGVVAATSHSTVPQDDARPWSRIRVAVRLRPLSKKERSSASKEDSHLWECVPSQNSISVKVSLHKTNTYKFDYVAPPEEATPELYTAFVKGIVMAACQGTHGNIFAYGQTNSGKTFTTSGNISSPGLLLLAMTDLLAFRDAHPELECQFSASCVEIYNEVLYDLLGGPEEGSEELGDKPQRNSISSPRVLVSQGTQLPGVKSHPVTSGEEFVALLVQYERHRSTSATSANSRSSRSHTIFRITIRSRPKGSTSEPQGENSGVWANNATLNFVDLAGSECISHMHNEGQKKECRHINKSLLALSRVVIALGSDSDTKHVPYRDGLLTKLLQPVLGTSSRTAFVCTLHPSTSCLHESTKTVHFGSFAAAVNTTLAPQLEQGVDETEYKLVIKKLRKKLVALSKRYQALKEEHQATCSELVEVDYARRALEVENTQLQTFIRNAQIKKRPKRRRMIARATSATETAEDSTHAEHEYDGPNVAELMDVVKEAQGYVCDMEQEIDELKEKLDVKQRTLQQSTEQRQRQQTLHEAEIKRLQSSIAEATGRLQAALQEAKEQRDAVESLQEELEAEKKTVRRPASAWQVADSVSSASAEHEELTKQLKAARLMAVEGGTIMTKFHHNKPGKSRQCRVWVCLRTGGAVLCWKGRKERQIILSRAGAIDIGRACASFGVNASIEEQRSRGSRALSIGFPDRSYDFVLSSKETLDVWFDVLTELAPQAHARDHRAP